MNEPGPRAGAADVYLHIGLPKSGTSYLQSTLWSSREQLAVGGVLVPGDTRTSHNLAVWDLMGRRPRGAELPQIVGSWQRLVGEVRGWHGSHAVISEEYLAFARPGQVRQAVRAFAPASVHVVVTVRDLARVVVSSWQQQLARGETWTWETYAAAVRDPEHGPATAGVAFWLRQDVVRVLDTWEAEVPRERIHVVTAPPPGSPPELLLDRFAMATRLDPSRLARAAYPGNVSVGGAEAEVLRQLNALLGDRLNERQYTRVVANGVRPVLQQRQQLAPTGLPDEHLGWVTERAAQMVEQVRRRDLDVVGELDDLLPRPNDSRALAPDVVQPAELADAAMVALATVAEQYATFWWRVRAGRLPDSSSEGSGLAGSARVASNRARLAALGLMDRSRLVRRLAIRYLRRSPRIRPPGAGSAE